MGYVNEESIDEIVQFQCSKLKAVLAFNDVTDGMVGACPACGNFGV